jgi:serine/threonine protein kinase
MKGGEPLCELAGSTFYMAPEVLRRRYHEQVGRRTRRYLLTMPKAQVACPTASCFDAAPAAQADLWSCGVILYMLLSGTPPFYGNSERAICTAILSKEPDLSSPPWPAISEAAKDCVRRLLVRNEGGTGQQEPLESSKPFHPGTAGPSMPGSTPAAWRPLIAPQGSAPLRRPRRSRTPHAAPPPPRSWRTPGWRAPRRASRCAATCCSACAHSRPPTS